MSDLAALLARAVEEQKAMSPAERAAMLRQQRWSYVIAEAGMGSDADEAAYRTALASGDTVEIARLDEQAALRMEKARQWLQEHDRLNNSPTAPKPPDSVNARASD